MKKFTLLMSAFVLLITTQLFAQRNCGTMEYLQQQIQNDPNRLQMMQEIEQHTNQFVQSYQPGSRSVITIPVVFHVVYNTAAQNISDALINAQIDQLNKDFARLNSDASNTPSVFQSLGANTEIQFCLAKRDPNGNATTGIIRKSTTVTSFSSNDNIKRNANGGDDPWPAANYLNIWTGNLSGGLLGYAQFPGGDASTDGVVLLFSSVGSMTTPGTATNYNLGRTATHEVGHWLNLRHIWGDATCGNDLVNDTPVHYTSNGGCPAHPKSNSCGTTAEMFMNYMDYTYDNCMNIFTLGQSARMNAVLASGGARASLTSSLGCVPPSGGTSCGTPAGLGASSITSSSATISWSAVSGASSYNVQYKTSAATTWTTTSTTATSLSLTGLSASTTYNYQVQAVCSGTAGSYSSAASFTTTAASTCSDIYESNNSLSAAKSISNNGSIQALIGSSTDNDYFKFTTTSSAPKVKINLTNLPYDYDVRLYNSSGSQIGISQNGSTTPEQIVYNNSSSAATYYVRVYGYNGAFSTTSCYTLSVATQASNFRDDGTSISEEELSFINVYPNPNTGNFSIDYFSKNPAELNIYIMDMTGRIVFSNTQQVFDGMNTFQINMPDLSNGMYLLQIVNGDERRMKRFMIQK
jgi:hypothetical protein